MSENEPKPFRLGEHGQSASEPAKAEPKTSPVVDNEAQGAAAPPPRPAAPTSSEPAPEELDRLGINLARALQDGGYHPVVLFGTNFSGKTSLLLSLFGALIAEPKLEAGLALCDPILGTGSGIGRLLHEDAQHTFDVKTQAFLEGERILKTAVALPFFVPVEFRPVGKQSVKFAFLESNGEWYRPLRDRSTPLNDVKKLYPGLRKETEEFISAYQGPITFLYLIPYTQADVYSDKDNPLDSDEIRSASLAITGVIRSYDKIRATHRDDDFHLMLVTKWDAHSARDADRAEGIAEDRAALLEFCNQRYAQALAAFQGLDIDPEHRSLNAYCSGIMGAQGRLHLRPDEDVSSVVLAYPVKLWRRLYRNALAAEGLPPEDPFPSPPEPPLLARIWTRLLDLLAGR
jgi:hypothetical protein